MKDRIALGEMAQKKNVSYMESLPLTAGNVTVRKKTKQNASAFWLMVVAERWIRTQLLLRFFTPGMLAKVYLTR